MGAHFGPGETSPIPGAVCVRLDAPLCFANAELFHDFIIREVVERQSSEDTANTTTLKFVLIDMRGVNHVDLRGLQALSELYSQLCSQGADLLLANLKHPVIKALVDARA